MKITTLIATTCLPLTMVSTGAAATITLVNADFSVGTAGLPFNASSNSLQGWNCFNANGTQQTGSGVNYSTDLPYLADPKTAALQSVGGNYISQIISASNEGAVHASTFGNYTIDLDFGYRCDAVVQGDITMEVSLWSGAQKLAFSNYTITAPTVGSNAPLGSTSLILSYDSTQFSSSDSIEIRIANTKFLASSPWDATALVDNVSITATAIPEPSTYAFSGLLTLGAVTVALRRRKNR